jgi:hypothetical protein
MKRNKGVFDVFRRNLWAANDENQYNWKSHKNQATKGFETGGFWFSTFGGSFCESHFFTSQNSTVFRENGGVKTPPYKTVFRYLHRTKGTMHSGILIVFTVFLQRKINF